MDARLLAHVVLSLLLLVQPVLAAVSASDMPLMAQAADMTALADSMSGCHETAPEAVELTSRGCCDAMEQACCLFGCASPAQALPIADLDPLAHSQPAFVLSNGVLHPEGMPSELFRPPRTI